MQAIETSNVYQIAHAKEAEIRENPAAYPDFLWMGGGVNTAKVFNWAQAQKAKLFDGCAHEHFTVDGYYEGFKEIHVLECKRCTAQKTGSGEWEKRNVSY